MLDVSKARAPIRECALQLALKEALAQQEYTGAVPIPPQYATVVSRAREIEEALTRAWQDVGRAEH
jgi:DNA-binding transcriptional regulator YdaS (Cro superfamily)